MKIYQIAYELAGKLSSSFNSSMFSATESLQGLTNKIKDINNAQKNISGFAKLEEDIRKNSSALADARTQYAKLANEMKGIDNPTKKQTQNLEQARLKVENLSNKLGTQKQKLSEVKNELKSAGVNYKDLSAENERLAQSTLKAQKAQEKLRNVLSKEQALNAKRSELQGQIVGAAAVAFSLAQPIRQAMEFESAMSDVRKVVDFDTPEQFAQMQKDILKMGRSLPLTHEGLAALVAAGGQAGLAREELAQFAEDAAKMATAFDGLTADDAGKMMANWRTAFKMSQDEVRALSDQINYLSNVTASDTGTISDIVTRVGALGDVAGVSAASIAAIGTTMSSVGVSSEIASTGIKNFMLAMVAGKQATNKQKEAYKRLGLNHMNVARGMQKDSEGTILTVLEAVSKLNKVEQASTLQALFGKESIGAISPLLTNLDNLRANLKSVGDTTKYAGSMQKEFEARNATTANSLQLAKNNVAELGINIGTILLPGINKVLEVINPLIGRVADFASENKSLVGIVAGVGTGLIALKIASLGLGYAWTFVAGGAIMIQKAYLALRSSALIAATGTKILTAAQWLFNAAMTANPIGLVIVAIGALIAAGVALYMHWDTVKAKFIEVWEGIKEWFGSISLFESGKKMLDTLVAGMKSVASAPVEAIKDVLGKVREYLPFSDAKVGPLSQLTLSGQKVVDTLREGMLQAKPLTDASDMQFGTALNGIGGLGLGGLDLGGMGSNTSNMNVTYSPVININGSASQQDINQAIRDGNDDFLRRLKEVQNNNRRLRYV